MKCLISTLALLAFKISIPEVFFFYFFYFYVRLEEQSLQRAHAFHKTSGGKCFLIKRLRGGASVSCMLCL